MIERPTVLVLGAGASIPLGYPSGFELTTQIIVGANENEPLGQFLRRSFRDEPALIQFREDLFRCSLPSIDRFLENRPEYTEIGKASIAFILLQSEVESDLFGRATKNWYPRLFKELTSNGFDMFSLNALSIVTFNYDRSLEQFLFGALKASFNRTDKETAAAIGAIPIYHMYGDLGPLPWSSSGANSHPYETRNDSKWPTIVDASRSIRVVSDRDEAKLFELVRDKILIAERVHFLGFGFDQTNFDRLNIPWDTEPKQKYYGTSSGLGQIAQAHFEHTLTKKKLALHAVEIHEYFHNNSAF